MIGAMKIDAIKTRALIPPQDDLLAALGESITQFPENAVLAVSSKVVSIWQGRTVPLAESEKDELVKREADKYLERSEVPGEWVMHTLKNNLLIPTAGIDESNANEHFVLWPTNPNGAAAQILEWLKERYSVRSAAVIITDSHSIPLRRGTVGICLGYAGFAPLNDYRKTEDIFGREFKLEQANIADGLAAAAVLAMGEGSEQTPAATMSDVPFVQFGKSEDTQDPQGSFEIDIDNDLYYPFLKHVPWKDGGGAKE